MTTSRPAVFSIDVEDWFHILGLPSTPRLQDWDSLPSRVERNLGTLLSLLAEHNVRATCFFLGWVAERYPDLVHTAVRAGHEVASHGFAHELVYEIGRTRFFEDVRAARLIIEDIAGRPVLGYRAPGFSVTPDTPWFFDVLKDAGYQYDASIFPAKRRDGGFDDAPFEPYRTKELVEFPVSVCPVLGKRICFSGGGYIRLFPSWFIRHMVHRVGHSGRVVNFYVHPRDIDPNQPRLPMPPLRRFQTYVNLRSTEQKLRQIVSDKSLHFETFAELFAAMQSAAAQPLTATSQAGAR